MLLTENIRIALNGLWSNKMRALLTMLGIIIGIGSVIGIVNVGQSMTNGINDSLSGMGIRNVTLSLEQKSSSNTSGGNFFMFGRSNPQRADLMTDEMLSEYKEIYSNHIAFVYATESAGSIYLSTDDKDFSLSVTGVDMDYIDANQVEAVSGRLLNENDLNNNKRICMISQALRTQYWTMQNPIGKEIDVSNGNKTEKFYIVGVYRDESGSASNTQMYIPITTAKDISGADKGYQSVTVVTTANTDTEAFINSTEDYFRQVYSRNKSYTVTASSMESMVSSMTEMLTTISLAIAVIAGISLLVGGIGVMNIMLVSITERTREIGVRKALGATNSSIRLQFITESIVICFIGGVIGIVAGLIIGAIGSGLLGYSATVSVGTVVIAVTFSMAIGVFFGYYPANKAAKLDPIEALRYE